MLDLETLDTLPSAVILSIGACEFDLDGPIAGRQFYRVLSLPQQLSRGRTTSDDTLAWWREQSDEARAVFAAPTVAPVVALQDFAAFVHGMDRLWSNGANFDGVLLTSLYHSFGMGVPWKFWQERCHRTLTDIYYSLFGTGRPKKQVAHNALADARAQAEVAAKALTYFRDYNVI